MKWLLIGCVAGLGLAGCGADGEPLRPQASAGVTITPDGVRPQASVGVRTGPVSVAVGL